MRTSGSLDSKPDSTHKTWRLSSSSHKRLFKENNNKITIWSWCDASGPLEEVSGWRRRAADVTVSQMSRGGCRAAIAVASVWTPLRCHRRRDRAALLLANRGHCGTVPRATAKMTHTATRRRSRKLLHSVHWWWGGTNPDHMLRKRSIHPSIHESIITMTVIIIMIIIIGSSVRFVLNLYIGAWTIQDGVSVRIDEGGQD